jgi:ADP-ribose pyrophosphatase YjhB (NUDIX family)
LLAVVRESKTRQQGLLVVRRNIEPGYGDLGLPGGFHNLNETWREACAREGKEETDLVIDPNDIDLFDVHTVPGNMNLTFGKLRHVLDLDLEAVNANLSEAAREETQRVEIMTSPRTLCFESHTAVAAKFFGSPG